MEYDEYFCKKHIAEINPTGEPQVLIFASFTACGWLCVLMIVFFKQSKRPLDGSGCSFHQTFVGKEREMNP